MDERNLEYYRFAVGRNSSSHQGFDNICGGGNLHLYEIDPLVHESFIFKAVSEKSKIRSEPSNC